MRDAIVTAVTIIRMTEDNAILMVCKFGIANLNIIGAVTDIQQFVQITTARAVAVTRKRYMIDPVIGA
ncbi:hypothetical protein D3C74_389090 [compost metagenome]